MATATTTSQLLEALAAHLAAAGLAQYSTTGGYTEDAAHPAVSFEKLPASPDTALAIGVANDLRDRDAWNPDVYVRLRFRAAGADPRKVNDLADEVYAHLETREPTGPRLSWPGGVNVLAVLRTVRAAVAADANGRWMRADTYRLTLNPGDD